MDTDSEAPELAHKTRIIETVTRGTVSEQAAKPLKNLTRLPSSLTVVPSTGKRRRRPESACGPNCDDARLMPRSLERVWDATQLARVNTAIRVLTWTRNRAPNPYTVTSSTCPSRPSHPRGPGPDPHCLIHALAEDTLARRLGPVLFGPAVVSTSVHVAIGHGPGAGCLWPAPPIHSRPQALPIHSSSRPLSIQPSIEARKPHPQTRGGRRQSRVCALQTRQIESGRAL